MKKLERSDFIEIQGVAEFRAKNDFADLMKFHQLHGGLTKDEISNIIFDDWQIFSDVGRDELVKGGFLTSIPNDDVFYGYEKHASFKVFTESYLKAVVKLVEISSRKYFDIPFKEKEAAKKLATIRWDSERRLWYVPFGHEDGPLRKLFESVSIHLGSEAEEEKLTAKLPMALKTLYIDTIPKTAWFSNLRTELSSDEWDAVRKKTYRQANYKCEVCSKKGSKHPVECHERWVYDESMKLQTLAGTIALCPSCHLASHYGFARVSGRAAEAENHLIKVNGWDKDTLRANINEAAEAWHRRNKIQWTLDATWILGFTKLSAETENKILRHALAAAGSMRNIESWQRLIVSNS